MKFVFTYIISLVWWELKTFNTKYLLELDKERERHVNVL